GESGCNQFSNLANEKIRAQGPINHNAPGLKLWAFGHATDGFRHWKMGRPRGTAVLQFVGKMVADVWEPSFFEQIKRQDLDRRAKKCAPAFLFVLNLDGDLVAPAAKLRFDHEPARTGIGNIWKFQRDIRAAALTSRARDPARPQTVSRDQAYSVNRLRFAVDQPAADADPTRATHRV